MNYPINLQANKIQALVIGAGSVGMRKIETLLQQNVTNIVVIDKELDKEFFKYKESNYVSYQQSVYSKEFLEDRNLVFIATDDKELNSQIVQECNEKNILCNVITNPSEGSFTLPAIVKKENLLISLSTSGLSPALSRALKDDIEAFLDLGYADFCAFLGKIRPLIKELSLTSEKNAKVFRFFVEDPQKHLFLDYFKTKDKKTLKKIENILEYSLEARIQKIILSVIHE